MSKRKITIEVDDADIVLSDVPPILAEILDEDPVSRQTIYAYANYGKMGPKGDRVYLETKHKNSKRVTSLKWIKAFVQELSE